jgi:hypothetical protein
MQKIGYSFAVVNFQPETLITQQDLKFRADSLVYGKYKQIKRLMEKRERQQRLNWFMSVVKARAWTTKVLKRVRARLAERKA